MHTPIVPGRHAQRPSHPARPFRVQRARARIPATMVALALAVQLLPARAASDVELLHWWTSEGEARAVRTLEPMMAAQGIMLRMPSVSGGADALAHTLRERLAARKAPDAVQMKATDLATWGDQGALASLDAFAKADGWDYKIPRQIAAQVQYRGKYVAIPVNVHRVNWLYINRALLQQVQGRAPQTWTQFFQLAERLQKAGITPLAHGNQPWQNLTLFETVVLGVGGVDLYLRALVHAEPGAIESPAMEHALQTFVALKPLTTKTARAAGASQDWNAATAQVITGQAAMQFMGDWAKGEFLAAQRVPEKDFLCASTPGAASSYVYVVDSLAVFRRGANAEATPEQVALARAVTNVDFQATFNLAKGSIPITPGVDMTRFDACAKESSAFFLAARLAQTLVPSVAHRMALGAGLHKTLEARVDRLWNDPAYTAAQAQQDWAAQAHAVQTGSRR